MTKFFYDEAGNLTRQEFSDSTWDAFQHDVVNRMTRRAVRASASAPNGGIAFLYRYDETLTNGTANYGIDRLTQVWRDAGAAPPNVNRWYQYIYDPRGNVVSERAQLFSGSGTFATNYSYDLADKLTQIIHDDGRLVNYQFDTLGQVSGVTTQATATAAAVTLASNITYLPFGPMKSALLGNGLTQAWNYDLDGRLSQTSAGSVITRNFAYDARDLLTSNGVRTFGYDAVGRLTHAQPGSGTATDYTYDFNGNRLTQVQGTRTDTYSLTPFTNRLYQVATNNNGALSTRSIGMNLRGETLSDTSLFSSVTLLGDDLQYTRTGPLASPPLYDTLTVTEQFNHLHQRIEDARTFTVNSVNTLVLRDARFDIDGQLIGEYNRSPHTMARQFAYLNGQPLAMFDAAGGPYWYHNDQLGTPQVMTNISQQVMWGADYDAFGQANIGTQVVKNPFRIPGQIADENVSGVHYNWYRFYDASAGRYLSIETFIMHDNAFRHM